MIEILLAFIAGILTIAAPCILLPLPIILGGSVGQSGKTRPLFITLGFVVSFATLALAINFFVTKLGLDPNTLRNVAVVMLGLFAVFMIWPTPFERLMAHMSGLINKANQTGRTAGSGNFGGFTLGVIIGVVWAPCAGPILGSILTLIALEKDLGQASLLLIAYAVGSGMPMLAIAYGGQALTTKVKVLARYSTRLQQIFGVVLILLAGAIYFQYDTLIQAKLVEKLPSLQSGFEQSIKDKLAPENTEKELLPFNKDESIEKGSMDKTDLGNFGEAPEFVGISNWLNSNPLILAELKGKVVLVDFWTYSCINCVRTLPYLTAWHEEYKDKGLVIVGVHTPEFAFEKVTKNVETALKRHKINYPVAQDNDFATWNAYQNRYWPAKYLIDKEGKIRYTHFGEGEYAETEAAILQLLGTKKEITATEEAVSDIRTPEIYFGTRRHAGSFDGKAVLGVHEYKVPATDDWPVRNHFGLRGRWEFTPEAAVSRGEGVIFLNFWAKKVFMVASSKKPMTIRVRLLSDPAEFPGREIHISDPQLYDLRELPESQADIMYIEVPEGGFEAFTFTFG